ncbi:MAG: putative manganese-dependent inorganic diphosphatase [Eubacteriales bacterium]|nr:putative manganese-dependent inorganic diphosphatase [Eubacteriales bacterium]
MKKNDKIFVIGHKNPDTDSICAAIGYAYLKNQLAGYDYVASRAGQVNEETKFVLERFDLPTPQLIKDVRPQVADIEIEQVSTVHRSVSLKTAWTLMREQHVVTLPVVRQDGTLDGVITIGDITKSYMEDSDRMILSKAKTPFHNLVHTLDAEVAVPYPTGMIRCGKVLVAAANPDIMESYIEKGDWVIVGNRYETQLCAIEMGCGGIIVSYGAPVSKTIIKLAEEKGCAVLISGYDTFTVARIINQSIPISFFMTGKDIISFTHESFLEDIQTVMAKTRFRDFPIVENGQYAGLISRRNLLDVNRKRVILVDHNEVGQAVDGIEDAEILEIIDHHKIAAPETQLPIYFRNQPLGCTSTIVYQMYKENGIDVPKSIAGGLCSAIISDTLMFRSPTCTEVDKQACRELAAIAEIDPETYSQKMFAAGSNMRGKSAEEIFFQDFKKFVVGTRRIGVGQINVMDEETKKIVHEKLMPYLEESLLREQLDIIYFMLTDIFREATSLLYVGAEAGEIIANGFDIDEVGVPVELPKIVSRKKQFIPGVIHGTDELEA